MRRSTSSFTTSMWYPVLNALAFVVLFAGGLFVSQQSLDELHDLRRMERVPATVVGALLPGEAKLTGTVEPTTPENLLTSPETDTPVVYYRYHVEREERDSDGDTRWVTVEDTRRSTPFFLQDETGQVRVAPDDYVSINATRDFYERRGNRRYSEYRIHPGDTVFVFGNATGANASDSEADMLTVGFGAESYRPIISQWSEAEERASVGGSSVFYSWLGLALLSCSIVFFFGIFRWHNTIAYLVVVTTAIVLTLLGQGYYMLKTDLDDARERTHQHVEAATTEIARLTGTEVPSEEGTFRPVLEGTSAELQTLPASERERGRRIRIDVARRIDAYNASRSRFPEVLLAPFWGHRSMEPLRLDEEETQQAATLQATFVPTRLSGTRIRIIMALALLAGIAIAWFGVRAVRTKRMIENIPTSPIKGVSYGLTEVKGNVELGEQTPLTTPLTKKEACWYRYIVKKKKKSGKKTKWVTITDRVKGIPFWCVDETDRIQVYPSGAKVFTRHVAKKRAGKLRYREYAIFPGEDLYVLGSAGIDKETYDHLEIRNDEEGSFPYLLSTEPEHVVMYRHSRTGRWCLNLGLTGFVLFVLLVFGSLGAFSPTDYMTSALIGSSYLFVLVGILHFNDLVFLQHRADRNRANIDVALQKRADLVRNLEAAVRELAAHEAGLLEQVAQLRSTASDDEAENEGSSFTYHPLSERFLALRESYPSLQSQEAYEQLMDELVHLEDEIALMRKGYNDAVERLNMRVESLPDRYLAHAFGFKTRRYVDATAAQ